MLKEGQYKWIIVNKLRHFTKQIDHRVITNTGVKNMTIWVLFYFILYSSYKSTLCYCIQYSEFYLCPRNQATNLASKTECVICWVQMSLLPLRDRCTSSTLGKSDTICFLITQKLSIHDKVVAINTVSICMHW